MVDVNTIKPGDKVVYDGPWPPYQETFVVGSPAWVKHGGDSLLQVVDSNGLFVLGYPSAFRVYTGAQPNAITTERGPTSCTCETMTLMRVGCKCGHFIRERENRS